LISRPGPPKGPSMFTYDSPTTWAASTTSSVAVATLGRLYPGMPPGEALVKWLTEQFVSQAARHQTTQDLGDAGELSLCRRHYLVNYRRNLEGRNKEVVEGLAQNFEHRPFQRVRGHVVEVGLVPFP
jgi:hypothetical protein